MWHDLPTQQLNTRYTHASPQSNVRRNKHVIHPPTPNPPLPHRELVFRRRYIIRERPVDVQGAIAPSVALDAGEVRAVHHERHIPRGIPGRERDDVGPDPGVPVGGERRQVHLEGPELFQLGVRVDEDLALAAARQHVPRGADLLDQRPRAVVLGRRRDGRVGPVPASRLEQAGPEPVQVRGE